MTDGQMGISADSWKLEKEEMCDIYHKLDTASYHGASRTVVLLIAPIHHMLYTVKHHFHNITSFMALFCISPEDMRWALSPFPLFICQREERHPSRDSWNWKSAIIYDGKNKSWSVSSWISQASMWTKGRFREKGRNSGSISNRICSSVKWIHHVLLLFHYHGIQVGWGGGLCLLSYGVRPPFLDGSTVPTNICTDMESLSDQLAVNTVFESGNETCSERIFRTCTTPGFQRLITAVESKRSNLYRPSTAHIWSHIIQQCVRKKSKPVFLTLQ